MDARSARTFIRARGTPRAEAIEMRPYIVGVFLLAPSLALAGHSRGGSSGGGGGGALSHVSSGLGRASSSGGSRSSGSNTTVVVSNPHSRVYVENLNPPQTGEGLVTSGQPPDPSAAHVEGYIGIQKVHDSDQSFTGELAVIDRWLRLGGSVTMFSEAQPGANALTLTMPELTLGVRIDDLGPTRVFLEGGAVGAKTRNDPVMDTSYVGVVGGVRAETKVAPRVSLVGVAQYLVFGDQVRASVVSGGVRVGPLQASLRVVDFNVGPALWGPEIGLRF